ncbi:hypothetical protein VTH82DRAFT_6614 [Thermothelomyces myriococcoides]
MSYGGYNPYGSNSAGRPYGSDPFDDRNAVQYGAGTHEMSSLGPRNSPQAAQQGYGSSGTAKKVLDECSEIQNGIRDVENKLASLSTLQKRALDDTDMSSDSGTRRELDRLTQSIMDQYRRLTDRLRAVKSDPESKRYQNQVDKTERELRGAIQKFQELEAASRREMEAQMQRQARIAFPDATDAEIAQMVNSETQIFQQAVLGSRGERANRVLGLHKERKQQMEQIERQLEELLDLMSRVQEMLVQDEVKIQAIETTTAEAATKLEESNVQLESAVASSRGARRKKFICLGICVLIVVIIVVAVVAYIMVNRAANGGGGGGGGNNNSNDNSNNNGDAANTGDSTNTGNTDTGNSDSNSNDQASGGQKRSLFRSNVLDSLQMNTARAAQINPDIALVPRLPRRLASRAQAPGVASNAKVEAWTKKRFVIDWEGPDATGSNN